MLSSPNPLVTLLAFIAVLAPLVFLHELGHYLVGRWCGIRADVFAIGFGREVAGWTDKRGTRWKIGWLPLGGYVQFAGDADAASMPQAEAGAVEGSFAGAALWKRSLTIFAGPAMNFLVAIVILAGFMLAYGRIDTPPVAGEVEVGSPAAAAGIAPGDRVVAIDGRAMDSFQDIPMAVMHRAGERMTLVIDRAGERRTIQLAPRLVAENDSFGNRIERGVLGIRSGRPVIVPVPVWEAPVRATQQAFGFVRQMAEVLGQLLFGQRSIRDMGGPLQIAKQSGEAVTLGPQAFVFFIALVSVNLGFVNLLPLPMLDGGHLMFNAIEAVRRKPVPLAAQQWAYQIGFFALVTLMIVVTFNDLGSFGLWQRLAGLIG